MTFKAVRVNEFGPPSVMTLEELPDPIPGANEVVIGIEAAGVNPVDTYFRSGVRGGVSVPYTPGADAAGVVLAIGDSVSRWKIGDRVYTTSLKHGAYAQKGVWPEEALQALPTNVSFQQGAGLHIPYATAYYALFQRTFTRPGETVLVHGASGGVGIASVQWAKSRGCRVIATAGSDAGIELVLAQGADKAFNHKQEGYLQEILAATDGKGVDVVLEMLANINLNEDLGLIAKRGRVMIIGSRGTVTIDPRRTMSTDGSIIGVALGSATAQELDEINAAIQSGLSQGSLRPVVGPVFKLNQAALAHEHIIGNSGAAGKVVLDTSLTE